MSQLIDQAYLRSAQYHNNTRLQTRIQFHKRFSVTQYDLLLWIFDRFRIPSPGCVLEVGCGSGDLWYTNQQCIPSGWELTLSDFSVGMLRQAQQQLSNVLHHMRFMVVDAQTIPFADTMFDVVIANSMLYHVPDRAKALAEIHRVLKPAGRLYAATVGEAHLWELSELLGQVDPSLSFWGSQPAISFTLDNGRQQLTPWFSDVTCSRYDDALVVTEIEPLITFLESFAPLNESQRLDLIRAVEDEFVRQKGVLHITKDMGMFEAVK
ncbi:MAG: methyltransferase domain-containing protein [Chloroflexota bacterium]